MSDFFIDFPYALYSFGDNESPIFTKDLSPYISLLDNIRDKAEYYQPYFIQDADRPDIISQKVYGTTSYHWTIFMVNDNLRKQGWPISSHKVSDYVKEQHPLRVIRFDPSQYNTVQIQRLIANCNIGTEVWGVPINSTQEVRGIVRKRDLTLGKLLIEVYDNGAQYFTFENVTQIRYKDSIGNEYSLDINGDVAEYNSIHHYEDTDGNIATFDPFEELPINIYPVTVYEHYSRENDKLREIRLIKSDEVENFVLEYKKLLRQ